MATLLHGKDFDEQIDMHRSPRKKSKYRSVSCGEHGEEADEKAEDDGDDEDVRWAVYIPHVSQAAHHRFIYRHQLQERPQWILQNDKNNPVETSARLLQTLQFKMSKQKSDLLDDDVETDPVLLLSHYEVLLRHTLEQNLKYKQDAVEKYCTEVIQKNHTKFSWSKQIRETNQVHEKTQNDQYEDLDVLDMNRFQLPIFEQFMAHFFEETDAGYDIKEQRWDQWDARFVQKPSVFRVTSSYIES